MDATFVAMLRPFLKYAGEEEITAQSRLRDLGLDSLREIELLFAVEDTFGVCLPDEKLTDTTFDRAGDLWSVIEDLRTGGGGHDPR